MVYPLDRGEKSLYYCNNIEFNNIAMNKVETMNWKKK
jgi:hypothetical protein